jgi:hypothetical protein
VPERSRSKTAECDLVHAPQDLDATSLKARIKQRSRLLGANGSEECESAVSDP